MRKIFQDMAALKNDTAEKKRNDPHPICEDHGKIWFSN